MTIKNRYIRYLAAMGYAEAVSRSKKYLLFHKVTNNKAMFYHLSDHGTLRWSSDGVVEHSYLSEHLMRQMVKWEMQHTMEV